MSEQQPEPVFPPGPYPVTEEGTPIFDALAEERDLRVVDEDASPDAYEDAADQDPPPVMNEDADDKLAGIPEGNPNDVSDLDGDDDASE